MHGFAPIWYCHREPMYWAKQCSPYEVYPSFSALLPLKSGHLLHCSGSPCQEASHWIPGIASSRDAALAMTEEIEVDPVRSETKRYIKIFSPPC